MRLNKRSVTLSFASQILIPKQIFQRLLTALAQVKTGNTSENHKTKSVKSYIYFTKQNRKQTKNKTKQKVYKNIMISIKIQQK